MKIYPVVFAAIALVLSTAAGFSGELPEAPPMGIVRAAPPAPVQRKRPLLERISLVDYSLYAGVIATHAGDWITTQECVRVNQEQEKEGLFGMCREALLPNALVESKVGLGAYEATTAGLEIYAQHLLTERNHGRIARFAQLANIVGTAYVVAHNYHSVQVAEHP